MQSLYSGLVSYWNLQDPSGPRLDLTGNANTLTNVNVVPAVDGLLGRASGFTAASLQHLTMVSNATIQGGPKNYTFACWAQIASKPANVMAFVLKTSAVAGQSEYVLQWLNTTDRFRMIVYRATDSAQIAVANSLGAPALDTWYFIVGWNDHTNLTVNIEVNAGATDSTSLAGATQAASAAALDIGANSVAGTSYLNGKMAEVAKWDRLLTRQERVWLYNNGRGRTFPFDGGPYSLGRHARSRRLAGV